MATMSIYGVNAFSREWTIVRAARPIGRGGVAGGFPDSSKREMAESTQDSRRTAAPRSVGTRTGLSGSEGWAPTTRPRSAPRPPSRGALALADIVDGARAFRLWGTLGWQDVRRRYR